MPSTRNVGSMRVCAMDIGSNSTRYMIADMDPHAGKITVLFQGTQTTRVGAGITRGHIPEASAQKTLRALQEFYGHALTLAVSDYRIVGTAALREADNAEEFCQEVEDFTGVPVQVLDPGVEAQWTELAVAHSLRLVDKPFHAFDIGGGSLQAMVHRPGRESLHASLPLGAVRLTQAFLPSDPPTPIERDALRAHAAGVLDTMDLPMPEGDTPVVGVGGAATTVSAHSQGLQVYNHGKVHGSRITTANFAEMLKTLGSISNARRARFPGLQKGRGDIVVAGLLTLECLAAYFKKNDFLVSDRGLLYGVLVQYMEEMRKRA